MMKIGIDFDNTIVSYDQIFYRAAVERNLVPATVAPVKSSIRNHLRERGKERLWTELQGHIYGPGIAGASAFPGIMDFLELCAAGGIKAFIVSHKTKYPYEGSRHDLRYHASHWLASNGFLDSERTGIRLEDVYFRSTKEEKIEQIARLGCDLFFDDLPEFLAEDSFPDSVRKVLFDPNDVHAEEKRFLRISSWSQATELVQTAKR